MLPARQYTRKFCTVVFGVKPLLLLLLCVCLSGCGRDNAESTDKIQSAGSNSDTAASPYSCLADGSSDSSTIKVAANEHREVWIDSATFTMGSDDSYREEAPAHRRKVSGFWIDIHEVTNRQFAAFVEDTGYITSAEHTPNPKDYPGVPVDKLVAGSALFVPPVSGKPGIEKGHWTQWWQFIPGASWRHPEGPQSTIEGRADHPVVHISYLDALAYAKWTGRSVPTEAQWELAAQAGLVGKNQNTQPVANTWQGFFPLQDKATDGFAGIAPVGCFSADANGVHDMIGNVWEWVSDLYQAGHSIDTASAMRRKPAIDTGVPLRVIKGGSHLCAANYCRRDKPASRQPQEQDFGAGHLGFRTVRNP